MKFLTVLLPFVAVALAAPAKRGTCANPEVRKEWRSLTQDERNSFHKAVKCLQTKPSDVAGQTLFDRFSSLHVDMFGESMCTARVSLVIELTSIYSPLRCCVLALAQILFVCPPEEPKRVRIRWPNHVSISVETHLYIYAHIWKYERYWDWTRDANKNMAKSEIFDPTKGFGGDGKATDNSCVQNGPYGKSSFSVCAH